MVVASRNDGFVLASDCADVKRMSLHCQVFELHSYDLAVLAQFYAGQYQLAIVKLKPVARPGVLQRGSDFERGEIFRINQVVNAHLGKILLILGFQKLIVVDACHRFPCSEFLGKRARHDVARLEWRYGDKQVAFVYFGIFQHFESGRASGHCHKIVVGIDGVQFVLIVVNQNYVEAFF